MKPRVYSAANITAETVKWKLFAAGSFIRADCATTSKSTAIKLAGEDLSWYSYAYLWYLISI